MSLWPVFLLTSLLPVPICTRRTASNRLDGRYERQT
jgi:hypothetical protein